MRYPCGKSSFRGSYSNAQTLVVGLLKNLKINVFTWPAMKNEVMLTRFIHEKRRDFPESVHESKCGRGEIAK